MRKAQRAMGAEGLPWTIPGIVIKQILRLGSTCSLQWWQRAHIVGRCGCKSRRRTAPTAATSAGSLKGNGRQWKPFAQKFNLCRRDGYKYHG
jgi:hypothetical protein